MKERKYKEDWRLEEEWSAGGRLRRTPVYQGPVFQVLRSRRILLGYALVPWILWMVLNVLYLRLNFPGATTLYVFLPLALSLFPGLYWLLGIWGILRSPEKMTRVQKENGISRVLRSSAGCTILNLAVLIGDLVLILSTHVFVQEWPGMLMLLCTLCIALFTAKFFRDMYHQVQEGEKQKA